MVLAEVKDFFLILHFTFFKLYIEKERKYVLTCLVMVLAEVRDFFKPQLSSILGPDFETFPKIMSVCSYPITNVQEH